MYKRQLLEPCNQNVIVADGRTLAIHSCLKGNLFVNDCRLELCLYVCDIHVESILGMDVLSSIGLRIGEDNHLIFAVCSNFVKKNKNVFYKTNFIPTTATRLLTKASYEDAACDFVGPSSVTDRKIANDYVFQEKTKRTIDKFSRNRLFNVGDVVLVKKSWR